MSSELRRQVLEYLQTHQVMTLATTGDEGVWAAAVFYANDGFDLIYLSAGHTRHAQNSRLNPRAAATIQEDYADWPAIQGIQCEGIVTKLDGKAREAAVALYRQKYPFIAQTDPIIQAALTKVNWYRLTPTRLYFIDNRKGFGHREELPLHR